MTRRGKREVERLVSAERAARIAGEMGGRWWRDLARSASTARTDGALDGLFRTALATMRRATGADAVAVLLANEVGDELVARAASGLRAETTFDLGIRTGQGMAGQVMASRQPTIFDDLATVEVVSPVLAESGLRSVAAVPILFEDQLLGVLYAGSRKRNDFTGLDIELLERLAERLAGAMERVRAFEREREARTRAERDADHLARLQRITSRLHAATSVEEIAGALTASLSTDAQGNAIAWSNVWLVRGDHLELIPTPEGLPLAAPHANMPFDRFVKLAEAVAEKRTLFVSDRESTWMLDENQSVRASWAALPMLVQDECVGLTMVAYRTPHEFEDDERDFLRAVTEQAAQAMDRARLQVDQLALTEISQFFVHAGRAIAEGSDFTDTLNRLAAMALPVIGDICLVDVIGEDGGLRRMVARHRHEALQPLVDRLGSEYPPETGGNHPAMAVIRTGRTKWSDRMTDDFLRETTRDEQHFDLVRELGFRSYVSVPLNGESEVLGALTLVSTTRSFDDNDVTFAEQLADNVAAVIDNARRYERTLHTSHILQQSLLPQRLPDVDGLQIHSIYLPATRGLEVGGDFYDLAELADGAVGFMVGDVAGHDREAAAMMGHLRSGARALAGQVDSPAALVTALHDSWELLGFDRIATGLFGLLYPETGDMVLASAGHYPPLLVKENSASYVPLSPGVPLGSTGAGAANVHVRLEEGDLVVLYTDGVIDEREAGIEEGMQTLMKVCEGDDMSPAAVCERIVAMLPSERNDDVALLALRWRGSRP
jgi:GAF domain-containing protein